MAYKCNDVNYVEYIKKYIDYLKDPERSIAWNFFATQLRLSDLYKYLMKKTKRKTIYAGYGKLDAKTMIVMNSFDDKDEVDYVKNIISKLNIKPYCLFFCSYNKIAGNHTLLDDEINYIEYGLTKEIEFINPTAILNFSEADIGKFSDKILFNISYDNFKEVVKTENKKDLSEEESKELVQRKKKLWVQMRGFVKYQE